MINTAAQSVRTINYKSIAISTRMLSRLSTTKKRKEKKEEMKDRRWLTSKAACWQSFVYCILQSAVSLYANASLVAGRISLRCSGLVGSRSSSNSCIIIIQLDHFEQQLSLARFRYRIYDKMDVRSDIEGQMQERGIEEAPGY